MMSSEFNITAEKEFFLGEDKAIRYRVFEDEVQIDISSWAMEFVLRKKDKDPDPPLIHKTTPGGIVFQGDFAAGTQKAIVVLTSNDTADMAKGDYRYSIKRTDISSKTVLVFGSLTLRQATAR